MTTINDVTRVGARSPYRILVKDLATGRGPGDVIATIYDYKNAGATAIYNSSGELHFTLPNDHPDLPLILPRKTHYVVQQQNVADGSWREVFQGLFTDKTALDDETILYGVDYLGLLALVIDERFDIDNPDEPPPNGSKYVDLPIDLVVQDQLSRAINLTDSPVGFMTIGDVDAMTEHVTIWSVMKTTLEFCVGLIDSHRQGTGKLTRLSVKKNPFDVYEYVIEDDPGDDLPNLRLGYTELVQGYTVVPLGPNWASIVHGIGRVREGLKVDYDTRSAPTITTAEWGHFAQSQLWLDIADKNDLIRRTKQLAWERGRIGQQVGLGLMVNALRPLDGYDICDRVPVEIIHGQVDTREYADYWSILAVTWESSTDGSNDLTLSITPRTDVTDPESGLSTSDPYPPLGNILPGPDGSTARDGAVHVHAIGEAISSDGITLTIITAQEFEPYTVAAYLAGARVAITEGATHDYVTFTSVGVLYDPIFLDYLAAIDWPPA